MGNEPLSNLRMIERHYFKDKLIKSFDFTFPFCIPNSTNSWEAIYELPDMTDAEVRSMFPSSFTGSIFATGGSSHCRQLKLTVSVLLRWISQRQDIIDSPMQSKSDSVRSNRAHTSLARGRRPRWLAVIKASSGQ